MQLLFFVAILIETGSCVSCLLLLVKSITMKYLIILFSIIAFQVNAQSGCTDPQAINYSASAVVNDGSCIYANATLPYTVLTSLQTPLLNECSGILIYNNELWVHTDDSNLNLYKIDSLTNTVFDSLKIDNTINQDWEDVAAGDSYIYVGDFGNNFGNRTNLHVLRIPSMSLDTASDGVPDTISFSYPDQVSFVSALNNNSFDCEAFFVYHDSLHLFTKDWITKWTKHYKIPAMPGIYIAELIDSLNTGGLITSADIQNDSLIVLLGYNLSGSTAFMWMLNDFKQGEFFSGNKRKFNLGSVIGTGQVEGIAFKEKNKGYITNETLLGVPPQLKTFDLNPYLTIPTAIENENGVRSNLFPGLVSDYLSFSLPDLSGKLHVLIYNSAGQIMFNGNSGSEIKIYTGNLSDGKYNCVLVSEKKSESFSFVKINH